MSPNVPFNLVLYIPPKLRERTLLLSGKTALDQAIMWKHEEVAAVLRDLPHTTVLIDHLAEPQTGDGVEFAQVLELAMFDQVYMKLSGMNHFARDEPLYTSVCPFTRRVVEAFGPERMVWGSGTPGIVDAHMEEYSEADRDLVRGGNVARILGWGGEKNRRRSRKTWC